MEKFFLFGMVGTHELKYQYVYLGNWIRNATFVVPLWRNLLRFFSKTLKLNYFFFEQNQILCTDRHFQLYFFFLNRLFQLFWNCTLQIVISHKMYTFTRFTKFDIFVEINIFRRMYFSLHMYLWSTKSSKISPWRFTSTKYERYVLRE